MITVNGFIQIAFFLIVMFLLAKPLGLYIARVFQHKPCGLDFIFKPIEHFIYRICGISTTKEMNWRVYAVALIFFNFFGFLLVYLLQRLQYFLPLNPQHFANVNPDLAFNTAASYITNTNWQAYSGENTLSYFTQMLAMTVQNFVSAATGMAVLLVLIRGIIRHEVTTLGNFWVDLTRSVLYILLPLAIILASVLVTQGVIQNFKPYETVTSLENINHQHATLTLPMGPAASQVAIKQLGTNGGGFFGANSTHPFENPTPLSNFFEMLALLLIPASLCFSFGKMVKDKRQALAIFATMTILFVPAALMDIHLEQAGNPKLNISKVTQVTHDAGIDYATPGGNMEGKETRFGIVNSALWATSTTSASNGSVNSMLDSYTPLGGLIPMWMMQLGDVIYGGAGSGLFGMIVFIILTVFIAGLMVGRTPEYLGKKIEAFEIKMACIAVLVPHVLILSFTAIALMTETGRSAIGNPGVHGFTEILYAFSSTANNNGSAFAGLSGNSWFYNSLLGLAMLFGRFWLIVPVLVISGSLAKKKIVPTSQGTIPTHTPLFVTLVLTVILILGALSFFPALVLGPIIEHLTMIGSGL